MGSSNSTLKKQIIYYYLFHKQLENIFQFGQNPLYLLNCANGNQQQKQFYVIDKNLVEEWKRYCKYDMYKSYFDEININNNNIEEYKKQIDKKCEELIKTLELKDIEDEFYNYGTELNNWFSRNILRLEDFDNLLDEKSYEHFKNNLVQSESTNIKGIITYDKLILFYDNIYLMKFIYFGQICEPEGKSNYELIQLTADFNQITNGHYDIENTKDAYNNFTNKICNNINKPFELFERKNIRFLKEETINFKVYYGNGYGDFIYYSFLLRNENLSSKSLNQNYQTINNQNLNPNNFRLIGLANVGATCYMNATLQCFFNVPKLTKYL